jgi:hypothetical protein
VYHKYVRYKLLDNNSAFVTFIHKYILYHESLNKDIAAGPKEFVYKALATVPYLISFLEGENIVSQTFHDALNIEL